MNLIYFFLLASHLSASIISPPMLSNETKMETCLRMRGWVHTSPALFTFIEEAIHLPQGPTPPQYQFLQSWVSEGYGDALLPILDHVKEQPWIKGLQSEFKNPVDWCPLRCDALSFHKISIHLPDGDTQKLTRLCKGNCQIKSRGYRSSEKHYCDCTLNGENCDQLTRQEQSFIRKTNLFHKQKLSGFMSGSWRMIADESVNINKLKANPTDDGTAHK